ncbi:hypothetical protein PVAP13_1KG309605 [Panicum virgatum]|uniref:Uncharacterized protein n=1 Tax=Panicum virgatum TaxID=38727 RepID=A0A8T0XHI5_PANVG|nr:hypothetical protein PVAP13_1KG309605 [Panicum virgatum]
MSTYEEVRPIENAKGTALLIFYAMFTGFSNMWIVQSPTVSNRASTSLHFRSMCFFFFLFPLWKEFSQRSRQAHPRQRNHEKGKKGKRPKTLPRQKGIDHQELQKALASPATKPYLIQSTISV